MAATALSAGYWLAQTLVGGGLLLLLACGLVAWTTQPARRQQLGEWAMLAALLLPLLSLAPAWRVVTVTMPTSSRGPDHAPAVAAPAQSGQDQPQFQPGLAPAPEAVAPSAMRPEPAPWPSSPAPLQAVTPRDGQQVRWQWPSLQELIHWGLAAYAIGAGLLLGHWLLGHLALAWLLYRARPAPPWLTQLLAEMSVTRPLPSLLISRHVRVPFSCGLLRPTIMLPALLCETGSSATLRWVLAHELTHLERHDARAGLLFGLGQLLYFPLPWFWGLRRQVRLCQEYVADSVAAAVGRPEDYAQLLLSWAAAPAPPAGAPGVFGHNSDLFRRVTMLLQPHRPVERRCPRRWSLTAAVGLLSLAGLVAGVRLQTQAAQAPKEEPKKEQPKKETPKQEGRVPLKPDSVTPNLDGVFKDLKGLNPEEFKQLREQMERFREEWMNALGQAPNFLFRNEFPFARNERGRLGVRVAPPSPALADQLDLPRNQGLVIEGVQPDSAASKAGLKDHDILLELNGKAVPTNPMEFAAMVNDIKANTPVDAVVLRKGKKETVKGISLPEAKPAAPGGAAFDFGFPTMPPGFNFAPFPGGVFVGPRGKGAMTSTFRDNDHFTSQLQDGGVAITVLGKVEDGKTKVSEIQIKEGNKTEKYDSVDKVPEQYRDRVKRLLEMSAKPRPDFKEELDFNEDR